MIRNIIRMQNHHVMVFDESGEQLPRYQGEYKRVKEKILRDAPSGARFLHWYDSRPEPVSVTPDTW